MNTERSTVRVYLFLLSDWYNTRMKRLMSSRVPTGYSWMWGWKAFSLFLLIHTASAWIYQYLKSPIPVQNEYFGTDMSSDGDLLIVGAPYNVQAFRRSDNEWNYVDSLKISTSFLRGDSFGSRVKLNGNVLIVSAPTDNSDAVGINGDNTPSGNVDAGAVYVYDLNDGETWEQNSFIKSSNSRALHIFGHSIDIDGDTLVVGAPGERALDLNDPDDNSGFFVGAAYVFQYNDTNDEWIETAYLKSPNPQNSAQFGWSVAILNDQIFVGEPEVESGNVYLFERNDDETWELVRTISPESPMGFHAFGSSLDISENFLIVGAPFEDGVTLGVSVGPGSTQGGPTGAAYIYHFNSSAEWELSAYLKANYLLDDRSFFGSSVAIKGSYAIVGTPGDNTALGGVNREPSGRKDNSGAGFIYFFNSTWTFYAYVKADIPNAGDEFGSSVEISEELFPEPLFLFSAPRERSNSPSDPSNTALANAGAVYSVAYSDAFCCTTGTTGTTGVLTTGVFTTGIITTGVATTGVVTTGTVTTGGITGVATTGVTFPLSEEQVENVVQVPSIVFDAPVTRERVNSGAGVSLQRLFVNNFQVTPIWSDGLEPLCEDQGTRLRCVFPLIHLFLNFSWKVRQMIREVSGTGTVALISSEVEVILTLSGNRQSVTQVTGTATWETEALTLSSLPYPQAGLESWITQHFLSNNFESAIEETLWTSIRNRVNLSL